jgi:hypothetical protein
MPLEVVTSAGKRSCGNIGVPSLVLLKIDGRLNPFRDDPQLPGVDK